MFNFCVVVAGHDKVIDTGRANTSRCTFKAPLLQKMTKKGLSENIGFMEETFEEFRQRILKCAPDLYQTTSWNTRSLKPLGDILCNQEKTNVEK